MDASLTPAPAGRTPPRSPIGHDELRAILSNLSHELCRPLISLRAGFDLLLGDDARPISPDQRGHVQTMVTLCDNLMLLTRSYLDYAGLVQGNRPLCYGAFTLGALVREIHRQGVSEAAKRRISWECALEGADVTVTTDASRCQQIFGNLISNALKYTPQGGHVRVGGRLEVDHWAVFVADDGLGIPDNAIGKVFDPFFRLARRASRDRRQWPRTGHLSRDGRADGWDDRDRVDARRRDPRHCPAPRRSPRPEPEPNADAILSTAPSNRGTSETPRKWLRSSANSGP